MSKKIKKQRKAYIVHTGLLNEDEDQSNWSKYNVIAFDAGDAINTVTAFFIVGEYAVSVELVLVMIN